MTFRGADGRSGHRARPDPYPLPHRAAHEVLEGDRPEAAVVIGFPSLDAARA